MVPIEHTVAIAGFDCRIDEDGHSHPWRMIVWRPTSSGDIVVRRIGALPEGLRWLSIPRDPLYGDLQMLPHLPLVLQSQEIAAELLNAGMHAILVADETCAPMLFENLRWHGIEISEMEGYLEKAGYITDPFLEPHAEFPGQAGREIYNIKKITGVAL